MQPGTRTYHLVIALLAAGVGIAWSQCLDSAGSLGTASPPTSDAEDSSRSALEHTYFVDVEGRYGITPHEVAVHSKNDLTARSNEEMTAALPTKLGDWRQSKRDPDLTGDPTLAAFFRDPKVGLRRAYRDRAGHTLTLVVTGNQGGREPRPLQPHARDLLSRRPVASR